MIQKLHTYLISILTETKNYHSKISDITNLLLSLQHTTVQSSYNKFYDEELHDKVSQLVKFFIDKYRTPPCNLRSEHSESNISEVPIFTNRSS